MNKLIVFLQNQQINVLENYLNVSDEFAQDIEDAANLAIAISKKDFTSNLELYLSCEKLPKIQYVKIIIKEEKDGKVQNLGKTEFVPANLNVIRFMKSFVVACNQQQLADENSYLKLKFEVYGINEISQQDDFDKYQLIGEFYQFYMSCHRKELTVPASKLESDNNLLKFQVFELQKDKGAVSLGECERELLQLSPGVEFPLQKNQLPVGTLSIQRMEKMDKNTFLNYIYAGSGLSLIVAMDFTSESMILADSMHNLKDEENPYIQAINQVIGILQYFDNEYQIPFYGFGAKLPPYYKVVSHCFACNNNYFDPTVNGLNGIVQTYKQIIPQIKFHGPVVLSEIVELALE